MVDLVAGTASTPDNAISIGPFTDCAVDRIANVQVEGRPSLAVPGGDHNTVLEEEDPGWEEGTVVDHRHSIVGQT